MSTEPDQLPSPQQIDAVLEFVPALARLQEADGNETIALSMDALYDNGFVIDCDWPAYQDEAERFYLEPERSPRRT